MYLNAHCVLSTGHMRNNNAWCLRPRNFQATWKVRYVRGLSQCCCTGTCTHNFPLKYIGPPVHYCKNFFSPSTVDCRLLEGRAVASFTSHRDLHNLEQIISVTMYGGLPGLGSVFRYIFRHTLCDL